MGARVQELYGVPMDVEWARRDGAFAIVQARPITGLRPQVEEWNDSLKGEYLWTAGNFGEAIPDVMTPITWSFVQLFIHEAMSASTLPGFDMVGNIGGRFYMNLTPVFALAKAMRVQSWSAALESVFGKIPPGLDIPKVKVFRWATLRRVLPVAISVRLRVRANLKTMRAFLADSPQRCEALRARLAATTTGGAGRPVREPRSPRTSSRRAACWRRREAGRREPGQAPRHVARDDGRPRRRGDAHRCHRVHELASLELITGLNRLARAARSPATSSPAATGTAARTSSSCRSRGPVEDPGWTDAQLAGMREPAHRHERAARPAGQGPGGGLGPLRRALPRQGRACASGCGAGERSCATGRPRARRPSGRSGCCARSS